MRPVDRGAPRRPYTDYNLALGDLYEVLGRHCSYCERPYSGDVEHVLPKADHPALRTTWSNFLLACKNCNSIKSVQQDPGDPADPVTARALYFWPDEDNTALVFTHSRAAITESPTLPAPLRPIALATMTLTGFHRIPGTRNPPQSPKDMRWKEREAAWDLAERKASQIHADPGNAALRETTAELAAATGFWSVWRTVFASDADMLVRFNAGFPGTATDSSDANGRPIQRPGGRP